MSIKHLVFDWDGTLADTFPVITAAYNHAFDQLGMERIPYAEIKRITSRLQNKDMLENIFGQHKIEAGIAYYDFIKKHHATNLEAMPHAQKLLEYCQKQGLKCYLITNKKTPFIKAEIAKLGFDNFFSKIVAAGEYAEDKPHPLATHALFDNNLPPAPEILVIGDGEADVKTAHTYDHNGQKAKSLIYDPKQTYQGDDPDYKISDLLDIIKILEEENA